MPGSITRPWCWRIPDFNKSGAVVQLTSRLMWADTPSRLDARGLLNHVGCGGGQVQVRRKVNKGKQWITEINQGIPAITSPPLWEEKAACWWLYDGWLIQNPSDLVMDHRKMEQDIAKLKKTVGSGVWEKHPHAEKNLLMWFMYINRELSLLVIHHVSTQRICLKLC